MFDIGFAEIMVIAVVALIVIGPERLPKTARTLGHLLGRLQRYVNDVKSDINREMEIEELRKLQQEVKSAAQEIETSVQSAARNIEGSVRSIESELARAGDDPRAATAASALSELAEPPADQPDSAARQPSLPGFERI